MGSKGDTQYEVLYKPIGTVTCNSNIEIDNSFFMRVTDNVLCLHQFRWQHIAIKVRTCKNWCQIIYGIFYLSKNTLSSTCTSLNCLLYSILLIACSKSTLPWNRKGNVFIIIITLTNTRYLEFVNYIYPMNTITQNYYEQF